VSRSRTRRRSSTRTLTPDQLFHLRRIAGLDTSGDDPDRISDAEAARILGTGREVIRRHRSHLRANGADAASLRRTLLAWRTRPAWLMPDRPRREGPIDYATAAAALAIDTRDVARLVGAGLLQPLRGRRLEGAAVEALLDEPPELLIRAQLARPMGHWEELVGRWRRSAGARGVRVQPPSRRRQPSRVVFHLGPTNSGKTHAALLELAASGSGAFAAPLRMLAQEAFERLCALCGEERVGLVTGEEQIRPDAPIIACTAEMAPRRGQVLVLDECHWAADAERGSSWTELVVAGEFETLLLLGAPDVLPFLRSVLPQGQLQLHRRLGPLEWIGPVGTLELAPRTVIIAFSRQGVLSLARHLDRQRPGRIAALYGAMPPGARRRQIARFVSGEADVIVATDVLGHGVNLPCDTVLFAETEKFDGNTRRPLEGWEVGQIAGRAGRFGLSDRGAVGYLTGVEWAAPDPSVARCFEARLPVGPTTGFRRIERGRIRPRLSELGAPRTAELTGRMRLWEQLAQAHYAHHPSIICEPVAPLLARLEEIRPWWDALSVDDAWQLAQAPADPAIDGPVLARLAESIATGAPLDDLLTARGVGSMDLAGAEALARELSLVRWFCVAFPGRGGIDGTGVGRAQERIARRIDSLLMQALQPPPRGAVGVRARR